MSEKQLNNKDIIELYSKDFAGLDKRYKANLINSLSGFKSVFLVGTKNKVDQENLTLVSSVVHIGSDPACLGVIFRPNTVPRHGYENILKTQSYTLNLVAQSFYKQAHQSSARYPREISEFQAVGLETEYISTIFAPFVKASPLKLGLKLVEKIDIKYNPTHFVIGEIIYIQTQGSSISLTGQLNAEQLSSVSVNGLDSYYSSLALEQLPYAKP